MARRTILVCDECGKEVGEKGRPRCGKQPETALDLARLGVGIDDVDRLLVVISVALSTRKVCNCQLPESSFRSKSSSARRIRSPVLHNTLSFKGF